MNTYIPEWLELLMGNRERAVACHPKVKGSIYDPRDWERLGKGMRCMYVDADNFFIYDYKQRLIIG